MSEGEWIAEVASEDDVFGVAEFVATSEVVMDGEDLLLCHLLGAVAVGEFVEHALFAGIEATGQEVLVAVDKHVSEFCCSWVIIETDVENVLKFWETFQLQWRSSSEC